MGEQPQTCIHRKNSIFLKEYSGGGERKDFWNVPSAPSGGTKHMSIKSHPISTQGDSSLLFIPQAIPSSFSRTLWDFLQHAFYHI